ncbi:MAG: peptide chain release factor 1 [Candidatus Omnitrophota bacterium]
MFARLDKIETRYKELRELLARQETVQDRALYAKSAKEFAVLGELVQKYNEFKFIAGEIQKVETLLEHKDQPQDQEFLDLAVQELAELKEKKETLQRILEDILLDEGDVQRNKSIVIEIRAGTGGEEAALFAADLYRMYTKYAQRTGWKQELISSHPTELGGVKEIIFSLAGQDIFKKLKYESGVHRVQRVPLTEASGRIHTSAVSVVVLPEPEEVDIQVDPKDLRIDVFRSTGPGGQGVNTTDSAVRITHLPTKIVVSCQDERSQLKNKAKAMRILRVRLLDRMQLEQQNKISQERKAQIGTGDRSEKIRTYNFPDRRVTDHRINLTLHKLELILDGELDEITGALLQEERKKRLMLWKEA